MKETNNKNNALKLIHTNSKFYFKFNLDLVWSSFYSSSKDKVCYIFIFSFIDFKYFLEQEHSYKFTLKMLIWVWIQLKYN